MNATCHQASLQAWLLHARPGMSPRVAGADDTDRAHRLRIYANAYRLRLLQVLAEDYPALRATVGTGGFDRLGTAYLRTHPSRHPSVRWFGAALAEWLRETGQPRARVALARFEWAQGDVFDSADMPPCSADDLQALPQEAWPALCLELVPALRMLDGIGNAPDRAAACAEGRAPPRWRDRRVTWLLWQQQFEVHWRALPADEARALALVAAGATFTDWCAVLDGPQPAWRAASLLKRWLADGLVAGFRVDGFPAVAHMIPFPEVSP
jgi:hypothetical protein